MRVEMNGIVGFAVIAVIDVIVVIAGFAASPRFEECRKRSQKRARFAAFQAKPRSNFEYIGVAADRRGLVLQKGRERVEREETAVEFFVTQAISSELLVRVEDEYLQLR